MLSKKNVISATLNSREEILLLTQVCLETWPISGPHALYWQASMRRTFLAVNKQRREFEGEDRHLPLFCTFVIWWSHVKCNKSLGHACPESNLSKWDPVLAKKLWYNSGEKDLLLTQVCSETRTISGPNTSCRKAYYMRHSSLAVNMWRLEFTREDRFRLLFCKSGRYEWQHVIWTGDTAHQTELEMLLWK